MIIFKKHAYKDDVEAFLASIRIPSCYVDMSLSSISVLLQTHNYYYGTNTMKLKYQEITATAEDEIIADDV